MNKLKKKVFFTIFILLSLFSVTILVIYNYQNYNQEYRSIKNNLRTFNGERRKLEMFNTNNRDNTPPEKPDSSNDKYQMMVMDRVIYSITFDDDKNISNITSHNLDETNTDKIKEVAQKIIDKSKNEDYKIGDLYTNRYSYRIHNNTLVIIDNKNINSRLTTVLEISLLILLLVEIIIFIISKLITNWIIKPVINSFNKQKQFVADASHELKTPLAVIMASSEALSTDSDKKWIYNIQNESERMNKLITNLLDLAKLENDSVKRVYEKNNLSKVVEKSVLTFESLIFEKDIKLDYEIEDNVYFNFNSDEIKQVISIILDNAIKHCSKNGNIIVNLKNIKDEILIEIKNTGEPIPEAEEEKIFERFYRIDKARNRNENRYGLGLAIAKQIIENHKGSIKAHSTDGYTTFTIKFRKK